MTPFPGKKITTPYGRRKIYLNAEQQEWLKNNFHNTENCRLIKASGLSHSTLHRFARELGLKKSTKGIKAIWRRTAKRIKDKCEKNGYYDTLRGQAPSQACLDAYKEYFHSDRWVHPLKLMKNKSYYKYKKHCEKIKNCLNELRQRQKTRQKFGLSIDTNFHIPDRNYTKAEVHKRSYAYKHGYIVPDCHNLDERWLIFYDADTDRRPLFEQNCAQSGFHILPLPSDDEKVKATHDFYNVGIL